MGKVFNSINNYLSLVKFAHTLFALPFALIGFFISVSETGSFSWKLFIYIVLCMVFARNAAMSFNRFADRTIDSKNPRTSKREIPKGIISNKAAIWFVIINSLFFIATTYFINSLVFFLSPVALIVILGYSYTKRFTLLCHFILGLGLSLAPIGAYISVTGEFKILPILYSLIVLFWVSGFDIIYALQDEKFDNENKLHSIPAYIGVKKALLISTIMHLISAIIVAYIAIFVFSGIFQIIGAFIFITLLFYQHIIISSNDLSRINLAFFTTNGIASVLYAFFIIIGLYIK